MTILERVKQIVREKSVDMESDSMEKLVYLAYYIGREEATREVSDRYKELIKGQRERAEKCRYHKMANDVIGNGLFVYSGDYAGDMTSMFGRDETVF